MQPDRGSAGAAERVPNTSAADGVGDVVASDGRAARPRRALIEPGPGRSPAFAGADHPRDALGRRGFLDYSETRRRALPRRPVLDAVAAHRLSSRRRHDRVGRSCGYGRPGSRVTSAGRCHGQPSPWTRAGRACHGAPRPGEGRTRTGRHPATEEALVNATMLLPERTDAEYLEMEAMLMAFVDDVRSECTATDPLTRLRQLAAAHVRWRLEHPAIAEVFDIALGVRTRVNQLPDEHRRRIRAIKRMYLDELRARPQGRRAQRDVRLRGRARHRLRDRDALRLRAHLVRPRRRPHVDQVAAMYADFAAGMVRAPMRVPDAVSRPIVRAVATARLAELTLRDEHRLGRRLERLRAADDAAGPRAARARDRARRGAVARRRASVPPSPTRRSCRSPSAGRPAGGDPRPPGRRRGGGDRLGQDDAAAQDLPRAGPRRARRDRPHAAAPARGAHGRRADRRRARRRRSARRSATPCASATARARTRSCG